MDESQKIKNWISIEWLRSLAKADTRLWVFGSLAKNPKNQKPNLKTRFRALALVLWAKNLKTKPNLLSEFKNLWPKPTRGFGSLVLWPKTQKPKNPKLKTRFRALVLVFWPKTKKPKPSLLSEFKDLWPKTTRGFGSLVLWPKNQNTRPTTWDLWFFGQKPKNQKTKAGN